MKWSYIYSFGYRIEILISTIVLIVTTRTRSHEINLDCEPDQNPRVNGADENGADEIKNALSNVRTYYVVKLQFFTSYHP